MHRPVMYVPAAFVETDAARLYAFTEAYDFGLLVTQGPGGPAATHVPFLLDADPGPPRLTERYEAGRPGGWSMERMPEAYISGMIGGIVGIEVTVERLEGKRKLSQNRTAADRAGVIAGLNATDDPGAHAVARAMALLAEDA